jgi:hypothetical protein
MFFGKPLQMFLCRVIAIEKEDSGLGEGPLEMSVSYFTAA